MPARKHNIFLMKLLAILAGLVGTAFTAFTVDWGTVAKFGHSVNFLYEHIDEIEHLLEDGHVQLDAQVEVKAVINALRIDVDSINYKLFIVSNRDSIIHIVDLFNRGKFPYDSLWIRSQSGHYYKTTVKAHFEDEHHD
jgi:hypothetical protein